MSGDWKDVPEDAAKVAICIFAAFLFFSGQLRGEDAGSNIAQSIAAMLYIVVPTSPFEVFAEFTLAALGSLLAELQFRSPSLKRSVFIGLTIWFTLSVFFYYAFPPAGV